MFALPGFLGRPSIATEAQPRKSPCGVVALEQSGGLFQPQLFPLYNTEKPPTFVGGLVFALPIFPGSHPPSIVGVHVLNFCVRDGNRWTHMTINTNLLTW